MRRKGYKLTGFAKFMIVLIFAAPIAYFIASYVNDQDPLNDIKNWDIFQKSEVKKESKKATAPSDERSAIKELELKDLQIKQLKEKTDKLEELIEVQKREIANLKNQIQKMQGSGQ
jgi:peptidoglycan hydrolase CwlO-like protein